ncbi:MAG: Serine/threonine protein kinase [Labilithrix sp.]|nr:Serine/threonine protein kinase [Labilithrix sp.]
MVEIGQIISSKYKLLRLLGDGGMGSVYEAEHLRLGTHVAIKVLHADLARRSGLIDRFLQEARVSAQIRSPHVVQVTDVESTPDGVAYLVMELLQGEPLSNLEKRERTLSVPIACEYTLQILQALEAAHSLGVVHRDLKPDNVFVTFDGTKPVVKLIDFGIAKLKRAEGAAGAAHKNLTVAGMMMGTPEYMAPEQAYSATDVDARADLYSVGVMLYEMLSGKTPAQGEDPRVVVLKVERGEVVPLVHVAPGVPPEVAGLVHRAMAPRPEMRFASAAEMRLALEAVLAGKRPGTAKIQQASAVVAASAVHPPYDGGGPPRPAEQRPLGTGTVMGAPAEAALQGHGSERPPADPNLQRPGTGTARAAPIDALLQQAAQGHPPVHHGPAAMTPPGPQGRSRSRKGSTGLVIGLAVVALLLGAGAVVAYVMSQQEATPVVVDPLPTVTTLTTPATPATTPPVPVTVTTTATPLVPPVTPPPTTPVKPHPSGTAPKPSSSAAPSATTPPLFPPFPSGFPSGFPSALPMPSGFPTFQVPSGFPPLFQPPAQ